MAKSKASELQSSIAQLENLFMTVSAEFSEKELDLIKRSLQTLKKASGKVQSKRDKQKEDDRVAITRSVFPSLSMDEIGDSELLDSIQMGGMG